VQTEITLLLDAIQKNLFDRALALQKERTKKADTWDEFVAGIESGHFVHAHWCGDAAVEKQIKEETGATIRNIPFDSIMEDGVCIKSGAPSKQRVVFAKSY
jgi:prolyl-tRNA synthetase